MGNLCSFSIPLDQSVNKFSQWLGGKVACIYNLKKNFKDLETAMVDLGAKKNDLLRRLKGEEARGLQSLDTFKVWLDRVNKLEEEVNELDSAKDLEFQRLCLNGFCSKSLLSSYRYGKSVLLTLNKVEILKSVNFEVIADQALTPVMEKLPLQPIIVGQRTMLEEAWIHLMKDEVDIMGMFGMGGVGKTTLLTQINNKFSNFNCEFEFVIWVVVSKEFTVEKIQDEIAEKVGLEDWKEKGKNQKKTTIFNFLKEKRFVLFLDDIWEKVDLAEIGVPDPRTQKGCKVAFTTRSQDVCSRMGVEDPMKVQCLEDDEAFDLFRKIVGTKTLGSDPNIPALARTVAEKCCGLPLAINVIGETMSCKRTIQEWRHAINVLDSYAADFAGMEDKILPLLKYSYDSLNGDQVKSCLLYCALYPEDYTISKENLMECWICEGIIDGSEDIEKAVDEGYNIIGILVRSSLLMEGDKDGKAYVRMHDVIREMALWIASELGKDKETFIVRAGVGLQDLPNVQNWKVVKRMSLMNNMLQHLAGSHKCTRLITLLLQNGNLKTISGEFFKSMPQLAVLDLSANHRLAKLPEGISALVSLRYLNLSSTRIRFFPHGLLELRKLIHLGLEYTSELRSIDGISRLQRLKVLKLFGSGFTWDLKTVKELEALVHLEILTTKIDSSRCIHPYLGSHKLMNCTQNLKIHKVESSELSLPATMGKVRNFSIDSCKIDEIKMGKECSFSSLLEVKISYLTGPWDLTFLMFAPNLMSLAVSHSDLIEDIIKKQEAYEVENSGIEPFQNLKKLSLENLQQLKMIYWSPLRFPCLEEITIRECPNLKKLPLDSKSCNNGENRLIIKYSEMEWIEGVEWKDEATKNRFRSSCQKSL